MIALVIVILGVTTFATLCVAVLAAAPSAAHPGGQRRPHPAKTMREARIAHRRAANDNGERERKRRRAF
jgi:hypothetical protein